MHGKNRPDSFSNDPVDLTARLVAMDSANPPGNEAEVAAYLASILESAGFHVRVHEFAPNRCNVLAHKGRTDRALLLSGHMDTVVFSSGDWTFHPLSAEVHEGRMYGRGTSDMKSGLAAMVCAAVSTAERITENTPGLRLVLTGGEETGCQGARALGSEGLLKNAQAVLIGEPTSNRPRLGHKGVLWTHLVTKGKAAHASRPDLGDNALVKALDVMQRVLSFELHVPPHVFLGAPSLTMTTCRAGTGINCVPDAAKIGLDMRTTPGMDHDLILADLRAALGPELHDIQVVDDQPGLWTDPDHPWVRAVWAAVEEVTGIPCGPLGIEYFTDGSELYRSCGHPPVVILGPGDETQAHVVDESCSLEAVVQAVEIYKKILDRWISGLRGSGS